MIVEISSKRLGATAVVDQNHKLVGIITDGDLRRMLERGGDVQQLQAKDIMSLYPKNNPYRGISGHCSAADGEAQHYSIASR